jgi:hypothetical protein
MYEPVKMPSKRKSYPAESRGVVIIADRVVELETHHIGEAVWLATGRVSEPLPSSPRLQSPVELTATGATEHAAIEILRRRIEDMDPVSSTARSQ